MAVKLEEKRAESKRKGNKNDFSLSTTPRQDKKARLLLLLPPMSFNGLRIVNPHNWNCCLCFPTAEEGYVQQKGVCTRQALHK
jgi:hypothetical protein